MMCRQDKSQNCLKVFCSHYVMVQLPDRNDDPEDKMNTEHKEIEYYWNLINGETID
jgi:hypothetical protein